jgi:hypothetical protein
MQVFVREAEKKSELFQIPGVLLIEGKELKQEG